MASNENKIAIAIEMIHGALQSLTDNECSEVLARVAASLGVSHERRNIEIALAKTDYCIADAARELRCSIRTLRIRMRTLEMPVGKPGRKKLVVGEEPAPTDYRDQIAKRQQARRAGRL